MDFSLASQDFRSSQTSGWVMWSDDDDDDSHGDTVVKLEQTRKRYSILQTKSHGRRPL